MKNRYKVNIKDNLSPEEALKEINKPKPLNYFGVEIEQTSTTQANELTNEGFEITKDFIVSMSNALPKYNAGELTVTFNGSTKIMGRTLILTMREPNYMIKKSWWQRLLIRAAAKWG